MAAEALALATAYDAGFLMKTELSAASNRFATAENSVFKRNPASYKDNLADYVTKPIICIMTMLTQLLGSIQRKRLDHPDRAVGRP